MLDSHLVNIHLNKKFIEAAFQIVQQRAQMYNMFYTLLACLFF